MKIVSVTLADNRENEIAGALESVAAHVDAVLLVDTGATDRTVERAREVGGGKLAVARQAWPGDFSAARNAALDEARRMGADWIVIVDSDERLHLGGVDLRGALAQTTADVLLVDAADRTYHKEKVFRAGAPVRYVGPTHEVPLGGGHREPLAGATFSELGKSSERLQAKFRRDRQMLTAYVAEHPDDPRWWFYLGMSHEGLGERERAAEAFGQCTERRRFGGEAAWAAYKRAEQFCQLERYEEGILAAARGLAADPSYVECAWMAGLCAFRSGRRAEAVTWARLAEAGGRFVGFGQERPFFFRHPPAHYELPYDVLRFALPDGEDKRRAERDFYAAKLARFGVTDDAGLDRLSVSARAAESVRDEARAMLRPPTLAALCDRARAAPIGFKPPRGWHPMNPSVCPLEGQLWCVVRTVNYTMRGKEYEVHDPRKVVRTKNFLGVLTPENQLVGFRELGGRAEAREEPRLMVDRDRSPRIQHPLIVGYEDLRLTVVGGRLAGSATVCDRDPKRRQIAALTLDGDGSVTSAVVQPSWKEHEKNWMPLPAVAGPDFEWVYQLGEHLPEGSGLTLAHLRGGAVGAFEGGYLAVAHEVVDGDDGRVYLHRFVRMTADADWTVTAVSAAWVFAHRGIEFCAGLAVQGGDVVMTYGVDDHEAWVVRVPVEQVLGMEWIAP